MDALAKIAEESAQKELFKHSVTREFYYNRGLIKVGDLVSDPEKIFFEDVRLSENQSIESESGKINIFRSDFEHSCDCGVCVLTDQDMSFEDIETYLLGAIKRNPGTFDSEKVTIYVFNLFEDSETKYLGTDRFYEFKGRFAFVNAMRGWVLLKYNKALHLCESI